MEAPAARPAAKRLRLDADGSYDTPAAATPATPAADGPAGITCRCKGACRNARCACVKLGRGCGDACRCFNCRNPISAMLKAAVDTSAVAGDTCLMHNLSKIKDMPRRLQQPLETECCGETLAVREAVGAAPYQCGCGLAHEYSWCTGQLTLRDEHPRFHCEDCRRCTGYRSRHCPNCDVCYFAGAGGLLACECGFGSKSDPSVDVAARLAALEQAAAADAADVFPAFVPLRQLCPPSPPQADQVPPCPTM